jgi:signal transduction histidine kinase
MLVENERQWLTWCAEIASRLAVDGCAPPRWDTAEVVELQNAVTQGLDRIKQIVRDVAALAREPDGMTTIEVDAILRTVAALGQASLTRAAEVELHVAPGCRVLGVHSRLVQAVAHLLTNAAQAVEDARRPDGRIALTSALDGDSVVITVQDNGIGIAPHVLPHVFDPFFTTRPAGHGVGLGLAVVKDVVSHHQGTVAIDSRPGAGTRVELRLPALTSPPPA